MIQVAQKPRPCDCENLADFQRYYRHSWVAWLQHPGGPAPVLIQQIGDDLIFASDLEGRMHQIRWRDREGISFGCPDLGMVNGEHSIIYLYQSSPRQPQKGYRPNGISSTVFNGWDLRNLGKVPEPSDPAVMQNLFFPTYFSPEEAFGVLSDGNLVGCALSSRLGLYLSKAYKYPNIAYRRNTIGHMQSPKHAFIVRKYAEISSEITKKMPGVEVTLL